MIPSVTHRQRAVFLFLAAAGYAAWFGGVAQRGEAGETSRSPAFIASSHDRLPRIEAAIARDPFAGTQQPAALATVVADTGPGIDVPDITALPPTLIAGGSAGTGVRLALHATLVGATPLAYVGDGDTMQLVRIGDLLRGRRVTNIGLHEITFDDGAHLELSNGSIPPPSAAVHPITPAVDAPSQSPLPRATASTSASPDAASAALHAIATVDPRGLPPGATPTPNLDAPTALPYPYPYPPARR